MNNFKDLYILTDMDGTLIGNSHNIPQNNKDAISRFVAGGGTFGIATGRAQLTIAPLTKGLDINGTCVASNGSVLFDYATGKILHYGILEKQSVLPFIREQIEKHPLVNVQTYGESDLYISSHTTEIDAYILRENVPYIRLPLDDMLFFEWNKMVFYSTDKDELKEVYNDACETLVKNGVCECHYSSDFYLELIPNNHTKGDAVERLRKMPEYAGKKFITLGDHGNDVKMLQVADLSISPKNAIDLAKQNAKIVADATNDDGLVAWLVERLESGEISL